MLTSIRCMSMLRCSLLLGVAPIAAVGGARSALAQADQGIETVVVTGSRLPQQSVTGSRLPQQDVYSARPVTVISSEEIKYEGTIDVATLLNNLPEAFADQTSTLSTGSHGIATADLRGLGAVRTLVTVDGSRLMPGDPTDPVPDLDDIPAALVDHVEVLTGGASTVYGSDALAGVVNFIMRKDFEGIEIDGTASIEEAPNDNSVERARLAAAGYPEVPENVWDGASEDATLILGSNTDNGKGNVTTYLGYRSEQPIAERDFSACELGTTFVRFNPAGPLHTGLVCKGSGNLNEWISFDDYDRGQSYQFFETGNGTPGTGRFEPYTGAPDQLYNFPADIPQRRLDTRYVGGFFAHYTIDRQLEPYSNFMFSDDHTVAQIAPSGLFLGFGEVDGGDVEVNCSNPLMTAQERALLCGADGSGSSNIVPGQALLAIGRRAVETGDRLNDFRHTAYRMQVGMKGDLGPGWNYDVYGQYGLTLYDQAHYNDLSIARVQQALQVDPLTGKCYAAEPNAFGVVIDPACVPLDIFNGIGSITPAMAKYIRANGFQEGTTEEQILSGSVTGDFGQWGGRSPLARSPVQASFGVEWRSESLGLNTDNEFASGDLYGVGGFSAFPLSGFDTVEGFGEINVPLVEDRPFVQDLAVNGGYRYASYSTAGPVTSYKYGVEWQPVADLRVRGLYERAERAPNVLELFTPIGVGPFIATDPCSVSTMGECAGVPNAGTKLLNCPDTTGNSTCIEQSGGSLLLKPEKGSTETVGIVLTPQFLDGFAATVDYFDIRVDGFVGVIDPFITLTECYGPSATAASETFFCALVHRNALGQLFAGGYVNAQNTNTGFLSTTGWDLQLDYSANFDDWNIHGLGSVSANFIGTILDTLVTEPVPGLGSYDCAGLYGLVCGGPAPRWRHQLRVTWNTPWDGVSLSLAWRHMGPVALDANDNNPFFDGACGKPCNDVPDARISSFDYLDVALDWPVRKNVDLRAGVNNIFAKEPPVVDTWTLGLASDATNTPGSYDTLGRTIFVAVTLKD